MHGVRGRDRDLAIKKVQRIKWFAGTELGRGCVEIGFTHVNFFPSESERR